MREQVTCSPLASSIFTERAVVPPPLNVTGQPWALTLKVEATPKSLLDCITFGDSPSRSSAEMTLLQRMPAATL